MGTRFLRLAIMVAVLTAGGTGAVRADAPAWRIDQAASRLEFIANEGGRPLKGHFRSFTVDARFDPDQPAASRVIVLIDMASATLGSREPDEVVKDPDWFAVARFPQGRFETTAITGLGGDRFEAVAKLSIRDVTREVTLPFSYRPQPDGTARVQGELTIMRTDYGVGQGQWAKPDMIGLDVIIRFDLAATRVP